MHRITSIAELDRPVMPSAAKQALSLNFGMQALCSGRKGGAANLHVLDAFKTDSLYRANQALKKRADFAIAIAIAIASQGP